MLFLGFMGSVQWKRISYRKEKIHEQSNRGDGDIEWKIPKVLER
jgi:hypothetical protein